MYLSMLLHTLPTTRGERIHFYLVFSLVVGIFKVCSSIILPHGAEFVKFSITLSNFIKKAGSRMTARPFCSAVLVKHGKARVGEGLLCGGDLLCGGEIGRQIRPHPEREVFGARQIVIRQHPHAREVMQGL